MRARMALLQSGRTVDVLEIVLRDKPASLLAISPKGTVPVLQLPDGGVIDESWDIMRWAFDGPDPAGWWSRAQSAPNLELLRRLDGPFKRLLDRYKYPERFADGGLSGAAARDAARDELLLALEGRLRMQPQLGGATPCALDLAVFPFVRQFARVDEAWFGGQALPSVQHWLHAWVHGDLFAACMARRAAGVVGPLRVDGGRAAE
jgi:glutathione S-transferase